MQLKKLTKVVFGSLIMGIGISLTISVQLGSDPMTLFWIGISQSLHITIGQANVLVCIILLLFVFFANRKHLHLGSVINPIVIALATDTFLFPQLAELPYMARILLMIIGLSILAFGIAYYALADYGKGAYEAMVFTLCDIFHLSVGMVRTGADVLLALLGILLKAPFSIGTLLAILCMGSSISLFIKLLQTLSLKNTSEPNPAYRTK